MPMQPGLNADETAQQLPHALHGIAHGSRRPGATVPNAMAANLPASQVISEGEFAKLSPRQKIEWLRKAAPPLPEDADPGTEPIYVGARIMTRKDALCRALDFAIESKRDAVPDICRQLVAEYRADDLSFSVLGVPFSRARLANWARDGLAPGVPTAPPPPELVNLGRALYVNNSQNVHDEKVDAALKSQLDAIRARVPANARRSPATADAEMQTYFASVTNSAAVLGGFNIVHGRNAKIDHFNDSVYGSLLAVWDYICNVPNNETKSLLVNSLTAKLAEIYHEQPCSVGQITRIIDTPTAIDWSLTPTMSHEHLREELRTLAAAINEQCSNDPSIQNQVAQLERTLFGEGTNGTDPEAEIARLIRERFIHTADVEFGMLRGIDRTLVKTEANRIFPEDAAI